MLEAHIACRPLSLFLKCFLDPTDGIRVLVYFYTRSNSVTLIQLIDNASGQRFLERRRASYPVVARLG